MKREHIELLRRHRSAVRRLVGLCAVLLLGHYSYHAVLLAAFTIFGAIGCAGLVVLLAPVLVFKRSARLQRILAMAAAAFVYCVVMTVGLAHGKSYLDSKLEDSFAPAIQRLEQHKRQYGHYPDTLAAVLKDPPTCRDGLSPYYRPPLERTNGVDRYSLTCVTVGSLKHSYGSNSPRWVDWD